MWGDLGSAIRDLVDPPSSERLCVHGEENCLRCAQTGQDFQPMSLHPSDIRSVVRALPKEVLKVMWRQAEVAMVAGGFLRAVIRDEKIRDCDIFVPTEALAQEEFDRVKASLYDFHEEAAPNAKTISGSQLPYPVQFIHRFNFKDPAQVLASFDLTIAQAAVWYGKDGKWRGLCSSSYYQDLAAKRLRYTNPDRLDQDVRLMRRVLKFERIGYRIDDANMALVLSKVAACAIARAKGTSAPQLEEALSQALRESDFSPEFDEVSQPKKELPRSSPVKASKVSRYSGGY